MELDSWAGKTAFRLEREAEEAYGLGWIVFSIVLGLLFLLMGNGVLLVSN